jgi:integrase
MRYAIGCDVRRRPRGELFGLRWRDYDGMHLTVQSQLLKDAKTDAPTKGDRAMFKALPSGLRRDLDEWKKWCGHSRPDDYIFTSRVGTPINHNNSRHRVLNPICRSGM